MMVSHASIPFCIADSAEARSLLNCRRMLQALATAETRSGEKGFRMSHFVNEMASYAGCNGRAVDLHLIAARLDKGVYTTAGEQRGHVT